MTPPVQLDLIDPDTGAVRRIAWRPDDGIFQGDAVAVEYCEQACAYALEAGSVCIHPIPLSVATPDPARDAGQLGAVLSLRFILPRELQAPLDLLREGLLAEDQSGDGKVH